MDNKLDTLIEEYGQGETIKERGIALKLNYIKELYGACGNSRELPLFFEIVENFCEILESVRPADVAKSDSIPWAPYEFSFTDEFRSDEEFFDVFRAYFSDRHAESTITDYVNRLKTFRNNYAMKYMKDFYKDEFFYDKVEMGHIYDSIEYILATFKPKTKTELNMYSALKKLNEYKNHRERA
ncbi:MAG: hypothetical protein IKM08_02835 [Clostridia bacterium]|nr:hypothetical protein [Clostridia bacterium]